MTRRYTPLAAILLTIAGLFGCTADQPEVDTRFRVVLDVGHSPTNPGAISASGVGEYAFNVRFVEHLAERLADGGLVPVTVIRIEGDDAKLDRRVAAIADARPSLILSIHHDSVQERYLKTHIVDGVERTYTDDAAGFSLFVPAETPVAAASRLVARALARNLIAVGERPSLHHAELIEGENRRLLDAELGVYAGDFLKILRTAERPAVLIEVGVIKNPAEERRLSDPRRVEAIVEAVAATIRALCCPLTARPAARTMG